MAWTLDLLRRACARRRRASAARPPTASRIAIAVASANSRSPRAAEAGDRDLRDREAGVAERARPAPAAARRRAGRPARRRSRCRASRTARRARRRRRRQRAGARARPGAAARCRCSVGAAPGRRARGERAPRGRRRATSAGATIAHAPGTRAKNSASRERPVATRSRNTPASMSAPPAVAPTMHAGDRGGHREDADGVVEVPAPPRRQWPAVERVQDGEHGEVRDGAAKVSDARDRDHAGAAAQLEDLGADQSQVGHQARSSSRVVMFRKQVLERGRDGRDALDGDAVVEQAAQQRGDDLAVERRLRRERHADRAVVLGRAGDARARAASSAGGAHGRRGDEVDRARAAAGQLARSCPGRRRGRGRRSPRRRRSSRPRRAGARRAAPCGPRRRARGRGRGTRGCRPGRAR